MLFKTWFKIPFLIILASVVTRFLLAYDPRPEVSSVLMICQKLIVFVGSQNSGGYDITRIIWDQLY